MIHDDHLRLRHAIWTEPGNQTGEKTMHIGYKIERERDENRMGEQIGGGYGATVSHSKSYFSRES